MGSQTAVVKHQHLTSSELQCHFDLPILTL